MKYKLNYNNFRNYSYEANFHPITSHLNFISGWNYIAFIRILIWVHLSHAQHIHGIRCYYDREVGRTHKHTLYIFYSQRINYPTVLLRACQILKRCFHIFFLTNWMHSLISENIDCCVKLWALVHFITLYSSIQCENALKNKCVCAFKMWNASEFYHYHHHHHQQHIQSEQKPKPKPKHRRK